LQLSNSAKAVGGENLSKLSSRYKTCPPPHSPPAKLVKTAIRVIVLAFDLCLLYYVIAHKLKVSLAAEKT
jgi:hypothetical protein